MTKKKYLNLEGPTEIQIAYGDNESEVHLSNQSLQLIKMFGPTIFADLRITPNLERMEWIIERFSYDKFEEVAAIPAQLDSDFRDDDSL